MSGCGPPVPEPKIRIHSVSPPLNLKSCVKVDVQNSFGLAHYDSETSTLPFNHASQGFRALGASLADGEGSAGLRLAVIPFGGDPS